MIPTSFDQLEPPFVGERVPLLKKEEFKNIIQLANARIAIFTLSNPKELSEYQTIWDNIAKGLYILSMEQIQYDDTIKNWRVLIRYAILTRQHKDSLEK